MFQLKWTTAAKNDTRSKSTAAFDTSYCSSVYVIHLNIIISLLYHVNVEGKSSQHIVGITIFLFRITLEKFIQNFITFQLSACHFLKYMIFLNDFIDNSTWVPEP